MTKMPLVLAMQSSGSLCGWCEYSTAITVRSKTVVLSYNTNDNRLKIDPLSTITAKVFTIHSEDTQFKGSQEFII